MYYSKTLNPEANLLVGRFVCKHANIEIDNYCSMGVFEDGDLIAGVLYHDYHPKYGVIEVSGASRCRRWLTRHVINAMFFLPFNRLGCQLVTMRVSERNKTMIGIARKSGLKETYLPRMRGRNEGEFLFSLSDDDWGNMPYKDRVSV